MEDVDDVDIRNAVDLRLTLLDSEMVSECAWLEDHLPDHQQVILQ